MTRDFKVTVKIVREHFVTITVRARNQTEADQKALAAYNHVASTEGVQAMHLGLPPPWRNSKPTDRQPEIDKTFRCVDCQWDTEEHQYPYAVFDELWAVAGMAPDDGMLCLACLEDRIGRQLTLNDLEPPWVCFPKNAELWTTEMRENWVRQQEELLGQGI